MKREGEKRTGTVSNEFTNKVRLLIPSIRTKIITPLSGNHSIHFSIY